MKKVIVSGMENSGTKMFFRLLKQHPEILAEHTSMPGAWMPDTYMPRLDDCDYVAWMIRYEEFRLNGVAQRGYDMSRPSHFIAPGLYDTCKSCYNHVIHKTMFIPYEGIIGPFRDMIMDTFIAFVGVSKHEFDFSDIRDENLKYLTTANK